jgi:hypothetical protein
MEKLLKVNSAIWVSSTYRHTYIHTYIWGRGEVCTGFWWGNLRERDLGIDGRIILRWIFRKWDVGVQTRSRWLRIGAGGRHL